MCEIVCMSFSGAAGITLVRCLMLAQFDEINVSGVCVLSVCAGGKSLKKLYFVVFLQGDLYNFARLAGGELAQSC